MPSFGDYIAARRKALNLKQKDLAAKIKKEDGTRISIPYLHDVEAGKRNGAAGAGCRTDAGRAGAG